MILIISKKETNYSTIDKLKRGKNKKIFSLFLILYFITRGHCQLLINY